MTTKTIKVKDYLHINEEYKAKTAITPGMVVELTSDDNVQAHSGAGKSALIMIALEDDLQGKGIDDAYAAEDPVQVWIPQRGDIANMLLKDGEDISIGDFLESAGTGYLQKHVADTESAGVTTVYTNQIIGQAIEAVDMSGSSAADPTGRIKVRII